MLNLPLLYFCEEHMWHILTEIKISRAVNTDTIETKCHTTVKKMRNESKI